MYASMNQVDFFKCLSDQTRLDILKMVLSSGRVCVCEITTLLQLSQPKISRHLALLRHHSILVDERKGQWVYYALHPDLPQWALDILTRMQDAQPLQSNTSDVSASTCCE
ncbi:ArsR family transcriptional regulator [Acinetobacter baylyi]|uniref:ArsR family transcriptional regulator n=2 Tax=Acinetobacter baylyi TaxID=202950 RepID=A0ABU0V032_ACIBI|nr:ArsR family transcriptional regulator [Acinetobacter baylyi]MDR6106515.1 ArsR family transcriptional regulator [Acinetobacter baylyi]MDR6186757.1 ArsR family transcriptional regulator [Acinetobacter baylyi]